MAEPRRKNRITFDQGPTVDFLLEIGEEIYPELTEDEKEELRLLVEELKTEEVVEFNVAVELTDEETKQKIGKRRRLNELKEKPIKPVMEWTPVRPGQVTSIILVINPEDIITYVENMPSDWMHKLFATSLTLQGAITSGITVAPAQMIPPNVELPPIERLQKELEKIEKETTCGLQWGTMLEIVDAPEGAEVPEDGGKYTYIKPVKFLGGDWGEVQEAIYRAFGRDSTVWFRNGAHSHWRSKIEPEKQGGN